MLTNLNPLFFSFYQVTFAFAIIAILIFVFSKYILPRFLRFINDRKLNIFLSLLFFILLLSPFKIILALLGLSYIFPLICAIYACVFTSVLLLFEDKSDLLSSIQLLYVFTLSLMFAYIVYFINPYELVYLFFAFLPMSLEVGLNEYSVNLPRKIALFMEGNKSNTPRYDLDREL
jgi:hypothetical protein